MIPLYKQLTRFVRDIGRYLQVNNEIQFGKQP